MDDEEAHPLDKPYNDNQSIEESSGNKQIRAVAGGGIDRLEPTIGGK